MDVMSPVGRFPMRIRGMRVKRSGITVYADMGAWKSEAYLGRRDVPLNRTGPDGDSRYWISTRGWSVRFVA